MQPAGTSRTGLIGLQLVVPIYTGGLVQSQVRAALASEDKAQQDLEFARRNAGQGARQAYTGAVYGLEQIRALESARVSAQSQLDSTITGYKVGVRVNVEVLDLPSLTAQAVLVTLYQALLESNVSTDDTSYHLTGSIHLDGYPDSPLDEWAAASDAGPAPLLLALQAGARFQRIYANGGRQGDVRGIDVSIQAVPRRLGVELETARLVGSNIVHAAPGSRPIASSTPATPSS